MVPMKKCSFEESEWRTNEGDKGKKMEISVKTSGSINKITEDLKKEIKADTVVTISRKGLHIASAGFPAAHRDAFDATIAMLATAFSATEIAEANMGRQPPESLIINGEKEKTVIISAGSKALLVTSTQWPGEDAQRQMQKAAEKIKMLLE